jgi:DNA-binding transcriptional LysR family regulator
MLDVRRLRLLREVAIHGSVTAAAYASNFTPSAVSQQLSALEREAGVPLLERVGRQVRLTDAAHRLVGRTETILAELERAESELRASDEVRGTVHLAAFFSAARGVAPGALGRLRSSYPDLRVILHALDPGESVPMLQRRDMDVAIVHDYDLAPMTQVPGLHYELLLEEPLFVVLPIGHRLAARPVRLEDLRDERWIAASPDGECSEMTDNACAMAGFEPRVDFLIDDYAVAIALVEQGLAVTIVPEMAAGWGQGDAVLCPIADRPLHRRLYAARRAGSDVSPAIDAVVAELRRRPVREQVA